MARSSLSNNSNDDLKQSELRYRTMFEQSPLSTQIFGPSGETLHVNKAWEDLWGATLEQIKGYNILKDHQLKKLGIHEYIKRGFEGKATHIPAVKYEPGKTIPDLTDVTYRWVRAFIYPIKSPGGDISEVILVHEDITEQKDAESALKDSEKRLRFMAESMPQKVFTAEPDGYVDYFNPQWFVFTGLKYEKIKGWGWTQFIHPDDLDDTLARWKYSIESGEPYAFEHRFKRHDGQYRWHITRATAMFDKDKSVVKWMGSVTDIHDIKLAHEREKILQREALTLNEQKNQLIALNKAKDEFISLASHQLRTPASGVKQFLGMVLQEGFTNSNLSDDQKALLELAYEGNERQIQIIDDLLKVATADAGNVSLDKEKVELVSLIEDIMSEQSDTFAERNQKIKFSHKAPKYLVTADQARLRMVIENIVDNASKYTPAGKNIEIKIVPTIKMVKIVIKDEGVGIAKENIEKIFQKFSRIDNPLSVTVGGTGLGLYWAKKIIDLHGGDIKVTSQLSKGSSFTICLPLAEAKK